MRVVIFSIVQADKIPLAVFLEGASYTLTKVNVCCHVSIRLSKTYSISVKAASS